MLQGVRARPAGAGRRCAQALRGAEPVRRIPALPGPPRPRDARRAPASATGRSRTSSTPALMPVFERIYEDTDALLGASTHLCEDLVDLETQFQLWRFRHMRTVMRIIGFKRGTGGSSGVGFLQAGAGADLLPGAVRGAHRDRRQARLGRTAIDVAAPDRPVWLSVGRVPTSVRCLARRRRLTPAAPSVILACPAPRRGSIRCIECQPEGRSSA